jgi:competence protein ComEC
MKFPTAPRLPFLGLALAAAAGIIASDFLPLPGRAIISAAVVVAACAVVLLRWPHLFLTYVFVIAVFVLLHSFQMSDTSGQRLATRLGDRPRVVSAKGCVVTEPKIAPSGVVTFLFRLSAIEVEGKEEPTTATLLVRWRGNPVFGDELKLFGMVEPVRPPRNPGEFNMRSYLARQDVLRSVFVRYAEDGVLIRHGGGNPIMRAAQTSRAWLQATLCRGLEDSPEVQNFISGIALGLRHQTTEDIEEPFQQTGTLHLFAVAGLHVGIVAQLLWIVSRLARLSRRSAAALIIPSVLFYAAVTGLHVSSVRAAIMSSIMVAGFIFERKVLMLNSLAAAAFLLFCWNTNEIFAAGFQLSFAVVATIILLADPLTRLFHRWSAPDAFLPRTLLRGPRHLVHAGLAWSGKAASVSLAAWIGSLVLILWYFYLITPISLFANLVVVPIAFLILSIGLLSIISAPLSPWLSLVFNNANSLLIHAVLGLVHLFAQVPAGHSYLAHPRWPDGARVAVNVLDVAAGAAVHVRARNRNWLFDCGSERDYERILRPYLHASGVNKITGLLLTHGDSLHIGGSSGLVSDLPPMTLIDNPAPDRSTVHRRRQSFFKERGIQTTQLSAGGLFEPASGVNAKILFPGRVPLPALTDDLTFVVQLYVGQSARVLLTSDSGAVTEKTLIHSATDLRSDILIKGQNHSGDSGSEVFLDAVRPRLIITTSREFPEYERVSDEWAERVKARGIKLFRQDETGAVEIRFRRDDWQARAYITGEIFRSSSR